MEMYLFEAITKERFPTCINLSMLSHKYGLGSLLGNILIDILVEQNTIDLSQSVSTLTQTG